jgi:hypothetical protein
MRPRRAIETDTPPAEVSVSEVGARLIGALPAPKAVRLRGRPLVTATLPNGRTVWLRLDPSPATIGQVNRLARAVQLADARNAVGARASSLAIRKLAKRVRDDSKRVVATHQKSDTKLRKKLAAGDARLHAKLDQAIAQRGGAIEKETKQLQAFAHRVRRRAIWDSVLTASSAPLFAAYGQRGRPLGTHHLTLAISLGVWLFGDELGDLIAGGGRLRAPRVRDLDLWSYLAPAGNVLTGWWLLGDLQHHRFVTGVADLGTRPVGRFRDNASRVVFYAEVDLRTEALIDGKVDPSVQPVAPGHVAELESYRNVPVVATIASSLALVPGLVLASAPAVTATVSRGVLEVTVTFDVGRDLPAPTSVEASTHLAVRPNRDQILTAPLRVAWIVDTREPK